MSALQNDGVSEAGWVLWELASPLPSRVQKAPPAAGRHALPPAAAAGCALLPSHCCCRRRCPLDVLPCTYLPTSHPPLLPAEWPVLHEGDGGREVHALHVALTRAGYYPSGTAWYRPVLLGIT